MKLIKLADTSDHGWQTVAEYMTNELADNSDDEKRIERAEKIAEKKAKKVKASKLPKPRPFRPDLNRIPYPNAMAWRRPLISDRSSPSGNSIGPCYKLSLTCICCILLAFFFVFWFWCLNRLRTGLIRLLCPYLHRLGSNKHKVLQATIPVCVHLFDIIRLDRKCSRTFAHFCI